MGMFKKGKKVVNTSNHTKEELAEIEAKFDRVSKMLKEEFPDEAVIVYVGGGVIALGSPIDLMLTYQRADREWNKQLKQMIPDMTEELLANIMSQHDHSGGDENVCPVHGVDHDKEAAERKSKKEKGETKK